MSFDVIERSNYEGQPVALYEFNLGTHYWRYTSDEMLVEIPGSPSPKTFLPLAISDSGFVQSGDGQNNDLTVTLPSNSEVAELFSTNPPSDELWLTIRQKQFEDEDAPVMWVGTIASSKQTGLNVTQFTCQLLSATFNRNGLRLSWGRQCPHALYGRGCRANKALFAVAMSVSSIAGNVVTAAALGTYPDRYFSNGFFEFSILSGVIERRPIENHLGDSFVILGTPDGLTAGMTIMAYPGCARTTSECSGKFNNLANYGGFPHLPGKSPFSSDPVF